MTEKLITDIAPVVVDKMDIGKLFSKKGSCCNWNMLTLIIRC